MNNKTVKQWFQVNAAIACLHKQLSEEQTGQQLCGLLEEVTAPFCNQLYLRYSQVSLP